MATIVKVLSTGSEKGSCVYVATEAASILVDAGPAKSKIEKLLLAEGFNPTKIDAIFVSHDHGDHTDGLGFADKFKIPVYGSEGTLKAIGRLDSGKVVKSNGFTGFNLGHLSNDAAGEALAKLIRGHGEQIYLTHMSSRNNTAVLAEKTVKMALFEKGFVKNKHYKLEVL
ncbi:MBL fold metallo-hydrolase [Paenibacillus sp. MCAF20]